MEEHNDVAEYYIQSTMFNEQDEIKMVNRYNHLNPEVNDTLEILQKAVDDIAIEVSLKAEKKAGSPPFLTLNNTRKGYIDAGRVLHCISTEGLGDPDIVAQIDSEINENNNAKLQFFVFFNMFEGKSRYRKIIQLSKPKVIKLGLTPDGSTEVNQNVVSFVDDNNLNKGCKPTDTSEDMHNQAAESLGRWQKIMRLTRGAVELPKCHLSFLAYNFDTYSLRKNGRNRGVPVLKTVEELPGQCILCDDDGNMVEIDKVQPSAGQRLLGVQLAADGNFRDEYIYRCEQSKTQAGRLRNSSASPHDAYMIYAFRYCPALFYCLHLTYFSKKECVRIQAPFVNAFLPKLRINRHMKRVVVGWPSKTWPLNNLLKVSSMPFRARTALGKTFLVTAAAYQLFLGTATNFFRLNPDHYPHRTPSSHSRMTYLWEELYAIHCQLEIPNLWTPEPHRPALMDAVVAAQQRYRATPNFITDEFVQLANACRLWLRVIYLDDIATDKNALNMAYYNGEQQCNNHDFLMPHQEKPPQWVWKVWQEVLQNSCLTWNQPTTTWHVLMTTGAFNAIQPEPNEHLIAPPAGSVFLRVMVNALPVAYRQILGDYDLPEDDRAALARALELGKLTYYSDGTVKTGCAAHAYTLRLPDNDDAKAITGGGPTCGDQETVSSLRPEHSGTLAGSLWIWLLELKHQVTQGAARSSIDNKAVISRLSSGRELDGTPFNTLVTDYNLWQEHATLLTKMTTEVTFFHVKGHQDDLYIKEGKAGPMTRDAHWNIKMDQDGPACRILLPPATFTFNSCVQGIKGSTDSWELGSDNKDWSEDLGPLPQQRPAEIHSGERKFG